MVAVGLGLVVVLGTVVTGGRASASSDPLCIGPQGTFVVCGMPGQPTVLPPSTTAPAASPPVTTVPVTTVPVTTAPTGASSTVTFPPPVAVPAYMTPGAATPPVVAIRAHATKDPPKARTTGGLSPLVAAASSPAETTGVVVGGTVAAVLLFAALVGLVAMGPVRQRAPVRSRRGLVGS